MLADRGAGAGAVATEPGERPASFIPVGAESAAIGGCPVERLRVSPPRWSTTQSATNKVDPPQARPSARGVKSSAARFR